MNKPIRKNFNFLVAITLSLGLFFGLLSTILFTIPTQNAKAAPTEPVCPTYPATTPTFNPFPLVLNSNSPDFTDQPCRDLPMLYWFPLDTAANNPRRLEVTEKQNVTYYTYYNNGAKPGSAAIINPNLKVSVTKDREVGDRIEYRISATLSADNATTVTSTQKGGDLILSVPKTTALDIVSQQTNQWPTRLIRSELEETTGKNGNDLITDNSAGSTSWSPIYTAFPGKTAASTTGFKLADNLAAGFLGYGLVSTQISADPNAAPPAPNNRPPVLTGQEITITRGQNGSFQIYNGTDPDGDVPLTYEINGIPAFCTNEISTRLITCKTDAQTPIKSTFTITPIDSKGLKGTPASFVVNIVEPAQTNRPPVLPGQEITITRGELGTFKPLIGANGPTDPDGDSIKLKPQDNLPTGTVYTDTTKALTYQSNAQSPVKITFTITPTDAKGLVGTPGTFIVNIIEPKKNNPPVLTGQEITIVRGSEGSFQIYTGTDPDGDTPLTYEIGGIPAFCTNNTTTRIILCKTDVNTPIKSTFTITPIDSKGLKGSPANFVVNIVEPQNPAINVIKTANPVSGTSVKIDEQITFNLKTTNSGQTIANNVILTDKLDSELVFVSCSNSCQNNNGVLIWNLGNIEMNKTVEVSFIARVKTGITTNTTINNIAEATFKDPKTNNQTSPIKSNETVHPVTVITNRPPTLNGQEITITRGQNGSFQIYTGTDPDGDIPLTYEIGGIPAFCTNEISTRLITCTTGANTPIKSTFIITPIDSKGLKGSPASFVVNIIDPNSPPSLTGQEITIIRTKEGSFQIYTATNNNSSTTYEFANLPSFCTNNTQTRIITCKTDANTPIKTTFTITPANGTLKGSPANFVVNVIDPDLTVTKLCFKKGTQTPCGSTKMMAGEEITYQIQVKNPTNITIDNVTLTDVIDSSLGAISNIQPPISNYSQSRDLVWNLGNIKAGETITGSFDARIKEGISSKIVNTVVVTSPMLSGERKATVEFTPGLEPAILDTSDKICKEKSTDKICKDANLTIGSVIVYTINIRNTGKGDAKNVKIVDTLDKNRLIKIEKINPNGNYDANAGTITWTDDVMKAGENSTFTFEATVNNTAKNGDNIVNTARITADNIPSRDVKVDFPVVIVTPITPRTGGLAWTSAILSFSLIGLAGFYYYKNNRLEHAFAPQRSAEVKSKK